MTLRVITAILLLLGCVAGSPSSAEGLLVGEGGIAFHDASGAPLLRGIHYRATDEKGLVFETRAAKQDGDRITFALEGPGAAEAAVTAVATPLRRGVALEWSIRTTGPRRAWNPWTSGFALDYGAEITDARYAPVTRWVPPTGAHPWEVPGDTPYPDTECQVRQVCFGERSLVIVSSVYDPDWYYQKDKGRLRLSRFTPPGEAGEKRIRLALLAVPTREFDPVRLAAEAAGRPVCFQVETGRVGNLFRPNEPVAFSGVADNVTAREQRCTLALEAWSYGGERLLSETVSLRLPPLARRPLRYTIRPKERGVVFVCARLSWAGGETITRTTLGVLPERRAEGTDAQSPFGMAALIANPARYPDQFALTTVLPLAERIGVRRLRVGWVPLKDAITPTDEATVRENAEACRAHGVLPFAYPGSPLPKPEDAERFQARVSAAVQRYQWGTPHIAIGNELNLAGVKAADYVERMLRPIHAAIRRDFPAGRIVSMGLGGVEKKWLDEFVAAGGMDLIDVLSVHPGCHPRAPEYWDGSNGGWQFRPQMQRTMAAARAHGNKEVWIDEVYSPTPPSRSQVDLRTSADYLVRTYVCSLALGVKMIAWYQFQDGVWHSRRPRPDDMEYSYGIVYSDLTPKPTYIAYGAMTEQLEGAQCRGRLDLGADDLYGVRFEKAGRPVDVLWSYREKHETDAAWWPREKFEKLSRKPGEPWVERWKAPVTVTLPAAGRVTVTDVMGNARTLNPEGGKVTLALTGSPVYVQGLAEMPRLPRLWPEMPPTPSP